MKLNNKGFSLIEVLAVLVILGILAAIMIPVATKMIGQNKEDNYKNIKKSILTATKAYISDHRYDIKLKSGECNLDGTGFRNIDTINSKSITSGHFKVEYLFDDKYLSGTIKHPKTGKELDKENSYIYIEYSCKTKNYKYGCFIDDEKCTIEESKKNKLTWK